MQEKYDTQPDDLQRTKSAELRPRVNPVFILETDLSEKLIQQAFLASADEGIQRLFHCYHALLCNHAVRFVSSRAIAEDIVSDIFYEFHVRQLHHSITTSYRAYLFASVRNRAFDYVRREVRYNASLEQADHVSLPSAQEPDSITHYEDLYRDVEIAIDAMPSEPWKHTCTRLSGKCGNSYAANGFFSLCFLSTEYPTYSLFNQHSFSINPAIYEPYPAR